MRKYIVLLTLVALSAMASVVTNPPPAVSLAWDPSITPNVTYRLYWGPASHSYTGVVQTASTTVSLSLPRGSTNYLAATCISTNLLESDYSSELIWVQPLPPAPVSGLRVTTSQ